MYNILILGVEILFVFGGVLLAKKFFGKAGLFAWVAIATILANVITAKNAQFGSLYVAIGTVLFASNFLATDILSETYGVKDARKAVYIGLFADIILIVATQIALAYIPSAIDYAHEPMSVLFGLNLRITISSMVMFFLSNLADVWLFDKIKKRTNGKYMWLRNNVSTILCNCLENFLFIGFAFWGIYSFSEILSIAFATSIIECIVGICDTPFLYISKKIKNADEKIIEEQ